MSVSLVRFKTNKEERPKVDSMTVFNSEEVDDMLSALAKVVDEVDLQDVVEENDNEDEEEEARYLLNWLSLR